MNIQPVTISFDERNHVYVDEHGNRLPSVSEVIGTSVYFKDIPKDRQQEIMRRGTILHQDVNYYIETGDDAGDERLKSFGELFSKIKKQYGDVLTAEKELGAEIDKKRYAGKSDIILEDAIVEIKSSLSQSSERLYAMQLAAYRLLAACNDVTKTNNMIICYLNRGKWSMRVIKDEYGGVAPEEAFLAKLNIYYSNQILDLYNKSIL